MKTQRYATAVRATALLAIIVALAAISARTAAAQPGGKKDGGANQWRPLFDGKSLKGWKATNFGGEGDVYVQSGAIVMDRGDDMTGITYAGKALPKMNYEVTLEGQRLRGGDFFCTTTFPVANSHCTLVVGGWGGTVVGISSINFRDASENETTHITSFKDKHWYHVRIRVTKDRIQAWIDKKQVVNVNTKAKKISVRAECLPCRPFGIATWRTTGAVRNIRIRTLTAAESAAAAKKQ